MRQPVLIVMAAGMGSRYGGLKQVDPVGPNGQTIMDYSLYDARRAGFERVVFVISRAMQEQGFDRDIAARLSGHLDVKCAVQSLDDIPAGLAMPQARTKPWGTGHAVRACRHLIDAPFAAINADDYYGPKGFAAVYDFLSNEAGTPGRYAMVGYALMKTLSRLGHVARGICETDAAGKLVTIRERTHIVWSCDGALYTEDEQVYHRLPEDALASMNLWGFSADFMRVLDARFEAFLGESLAENPLRAEYFLPEVVGAMLREGSATVDVLPCEEQWYGMTYREDRPVVEQAIREMTESGLYPEGLWG